MDRLLDIAALRKIVPVSRSTIWRWVKDGEMPPPVRLASQRVLWRESDIVKWMARIPALTMPKDDSELLSIYGDSSRARESRRVDSVKRTRAWHQKLKDLQKCHRCKNDSEGYWFCRSCRLELSQLKRARRIMRGNASPNVEQRLGRLAH